MNAMILATLILLGPTAALAELAVSGPWARASVLASRPGAAYLTLESAGGDRLIGLTTPVAEAVTIHAVEQGDDGTSRMVLLPALDLPAGERVELAPGGTHLMLMGLKDKLAEGSRFFLTLEFEAAGPITVEVPVLGIAATGPGGAGQ